MTVFGHIVVPSIWEGAILLGIVFLFFEMVRLEREVKRRNQPSQEPPIIECQVNEDQDEGADKVHQDRQYKGESV